MDKSFRSKEAPIRLLIGSWFFIAVSFVITLFNVSVLFLVIAGAGGDNASNSGIMKFLELMLKIFPLVAVGFSVVSIIFSILALRRHQEEGQAILAICCGAVFIILYLLFYMILGRDIFY